MTSLHDVDAPVSVLAESAARRLDRRQALLRFARGTGGAVAALSIGSLIGARKAFAVDCTCGPSHYCEYYGLSCPLYPAYCPSGVDICTSNNCSHCPWSTGQWVSCTGCGPGSASYKVCTDCLHPSCSEHCICLSNCLCTGCETPQQMRDDMERRGIVVSR
jgi:hypothetical protein